jgi:hypothetical protein
MGVLTDIVIADDAKAVLQASVAHEAFPGIDAEGLDVTKLDLLRAILFDTQWDAASVRDFAVLARRLRPSEEVTRCPTCPLNRRRRGRRGLRDVPHGKAQYHLHHDRRELLAVRWTHGMSTRFQIVGSFAIRSRNAFVLVGDILEGSASAGMSFIVRSVPGRIAAVEFVDGYRGKSHVGLVVACGSADELDSWVRLDISDETIELLNCSDPTTQ